MVVHRYSQSAFRSAWRRLQANMKKAGIEPFAFHDLKAKGISDHRTTLEGTEALQCERPMCVTCRRSSNTVKKY